MATKVNRTAPTSSPQAHRYDWSELFLHAMAEPNTWFAESGPDRPKSSAFDIRRGIPQRFDPAGAFDAISRKDALYIRYVGVPLMPWVYWEQPERRFHTLPRTFDPALFPEALLDLPHLDEFFALAEEVPAELKGAEPHVVGEHADRDRLIPVTEHYTATGRADELPSLFAALDARRAARA